MAACQTRSGPDRQASGGSHSAPELACRTSGWGGGGGVGGAGSCSWHGSSKPLLIINLGSSDKKRCISTFRPTPPPPLPGSCSLLLLMSLTLSVLCSNAFLDSLDFLSPEFDFILFFCPLCLLFIPVRSPWLAALHLSVSFLLLKKNKKKSARQCSHSSVIQNEKCFSCEKYLPFQN